MSARPQAQDGADRRRAFGPGKVILLGEHAVVYGHPAVAAPLTLGVQARGVPHLETTLLPPPGLGKPARQSLLRAFGRASALAGAPRVRVSLEGSLPVSMGLGSSAAVSVACARLLLRWTGKEAPLERVLALAWEMEREFHGTPSGIDHTVSARNELLSFRRIPKGPPRVKSLHCPRPLNLVVALAGARPPARQAITALRERRERWGKRYTRLLDEIGTVAAEGEAALAAGDLEALGDAMNVNHGLLAALGVSSAGLDQRVHALRGLGALGAKLTGAGGEGGAVVGLFADPGPALAKLRRMGIEAFASQIGGPGRA